MRLLVVGSCGKGKSVTSKKSPSCDELNSKRDLREWKKKMGHISVKARDLYTGFQSKELGKGVDLLRQIKGVQIVYTIISAGFGLVDEDEHLPPYECSFTGMRKSQIIERSKMLEIAKKFQELCATRFDLVYLALGKNYLLSLGDDWRKLPSLRVVNFDTTQTSDSVLGLPCDHTIVRAFSQYEHKIHGVTGFKGDLLRILANHALEQKDPYQEVIRWSHLDYLSSLFLQLGGLKPSVLRHSE